MSNYEELVIDKFSHRENVEGIKALHLGCGTHYLKGYVNLDFSDLLKTDVSHDLDTYPYPFKDNTFDYIFAAHTIEHLDNIVKVMDELHRICKDGAEIVIRVPHHTGYTAWSHLTHKKAFGYGTFNCYQKGHMEKYSDVEFEILDQKILYLWEKRRWFYRPLRAFGNWIINKNYYLSERFLWVIFAGYDEMYYKLKVVKHGE